MSTKIGARVRASPDNRGQCLRMRRPVHHATLLAMAPTSIPPSGLESSDDDSADPSMDLHLTTFTHEGRFWEVYLEFVEDSRDPESARARLCFVPTDQDENEEPERTAVIIIEPTPVDAVRAARALDRYHLAAMLRSVT